MIYFLQSLFWSRDFPFLGRIYRTRNSRSPTNSGHNRTHTKITLKVVDHAAILNFAVDIARGMKFLHELPRHQAPRFNLNPRHVVIDEDQRARLNLCDSHFSVLGNHKVCILLEFCVFEEPISVAFIWCNGLKYRKIMIRF